MKTKIVIFFSFYFLVFCLGVSSVWAEEDKTWGVSSLIGVFSPKLADINRGSFRAPLPVKGKIVINEGNSIDFDFQVDNRLPEINFGTEAGVELYQSVTEKDDLVFGFSSWEAVSTSVVSTEFPFQGVLSRAVYERSANISYLQYYFGWKRLFYERKKKYKLFWKITAHEVFDVDYKENFVFAFETGPAATFKRIAILESQATGIFMLQLATSFEYFLRNWLSLGFDVGYTAGLNKFKLGNGSIKQNILQTDNFTPTFPVQQNPERNIIFLNNEGTNFDEARLEFDGLRYLFRINFHF